MVICFGWAIDGPLRIICNVLVITSGHETKPLPELLGLFKGTLTALPLGIRRKRYSELVVTLYGNREQVDPVEASVLLQYRADRSFDV